MKPATAPLFAALLVVAPGASAEIITYMFTGNPSASRQNDSSYSYDGLTGITTYSPTYGVSSGGTSGSFSFSLDTDRYTDASAYSGLTYSYGVPASPWLTSTSSVSGPQGNVTLATSGTATSGFYAYDSSLSGGAGGYLELYDLAGYDSGTYTYDALGRLIGWHYRESYNQASLTGDVLLGELGGVEVPLEVSSLRPGSMFLRQYDYELTYRWSYGEDGHQITDAFNSSYHDTYFYDMSLRISRAISRELVVNRTVPEPASLVLVGLGLALLGARRRHR